MLICVLEAYYRQLLRNIYQYIAYEKEAGEDFFLQNKATVYAFKIKALSLFNIYHSQRRN